MKKAGTSAPQNKKPAAAAGEKPKGKPAGVEQRDISERREMEERIRELNRELERKAGELAAANRELESFGSVISHDLRNPLNRILTATQLLEDQAGQLDDIGQEMLGIIGKTCGEMNGMITALFNLSRAVSAPLRCKGTDLSRLATEIAAGFRLAEPQRQAEFVIPSGVVANGDGSLLKVLLENLLGNAWKYTSQRERTLIEFGVAERGEEKVYFVRDNGIGFGMADAERILTPFQRLDAGTDFGGGCGLGLATAQRIVMRHGGRIWAEGETGKGSTFFFTLPRGCGRENGG